MTPYGIVYKDNSYALEHSCKIWQKKYGVMKPSSLFKAIAFLEVPIILITLVNLLFERNIVSFILYTLIMSLYAAVLTYITANTVFVKHMARNNMTLYQKQAVIFDDRIEFTSPYAKSVYSYDEILYYEENADIITLVLDTGALPVSIYKACVGKGSYDEFSRLLREKLDSYYAGKDGM